MGAGRAYTWEENESEVEVRVTLPTGTRRNQLSITLIDEATGANLWRTEIETEGGAQRHTQRARLAVRPSFWPDALLDGVLRGPVDARESSYELVASEGGEAWDCLLVTIRKAPDTQGSWGGVLEEDAAEDTSAEEDASAARLCQLMAVSIDDAAVQRRCAEACARLADSGRVSELLAAKALAQLATSMRAHPHETGLQAAGCAVLARAPITPDAPPAVREAVLGSQLINAAVAAILRHPASAPVQLHGVRALLTVATGGAPFLAALAASESISVLSSMLERPPPVCDAACAALGAIGRAGPKGAAALVEQGAAAALFAAIASPRHSLSWRRACALVVLPLAEVCDASVTKAALAAGMLPARVRNHAAVPPARAKHHPHLPPHHSHRHLHARQARYQPRAARCM